MKKKQIIIIAIAAVVCAEFVKVVALFEKKNGSLEEIIYIDSEGRFTR